MSITDANMAAYVSPYALSSLYNDTTADYAKSSCASAVSTIQSLNGSTQLDIIALPKLGVGANNIVKFENGKVAFADKSVYVDSVMPDISDVHTIENNGEVRVVVVTFADGTTEKAVLSADDTYSLEYGISICVTKRLLSMKCDGQGNSVYNKIVRHGLKVYENAQKQAIKDAEEAYALQARIEKYAKKRAAKRAKREVAAREEFIEIQKEAYLRAMREFNSAEDKDE